MADLATLRHLAQHANSYTRLPVLIAAWADMDLEPRGWLQVLGEEWTGCDNISQHAARLIGETPFGRWRDHPGAMMDPPEQAALAALPDTITIFRGCYLGNARGLSWSTCREVAQRFPRLHRYRQDGTPLLVRATVRKSDIIALKLDREEREIITTEAREVGHG